ncbi:hypothetical protein LUZ60_009531 [Juncus effusus]|nr:hypothetical protein LUZ60_009531 [Juncus effusus]
MAQRSFFFKLFLSFYRFLYRKLSNGKSYKRTASTKLPKCPPQYPSWLLFDNLSDKTLVIDIEGWLLKSNSTFNYFMLVALEGGGFLRGFLLLCLYPVLHFLSQELMLRVMIMICFFGLRVDGFKLDRAILPKYFLENVGLEGFEVLKKGLKEAKGVVCVSRVMPRIMVEAFMREYMGVEKVVGREIGVFWGYFNGVLMDWNENEFLGMLQPKGSVEDYLNDDILGFGSSSFGKARQQKDHIFSLCKDIYIVSEAEKKNWKTLPREQYPTPLVFHDGRLAFNPTPLATLAMFLYLPLGLSLTILRSVVCGLLPYRCSIVLGALIGIKSRLIVPPKQYNSIGGSSTGQLYVCNHRTLLDPIAISAALNRPVTAVTYSLSRLSEIMSPIRTARLTRNKEEDRRRMSRLLAQGDLVVCPEGTTCREPYLLRFSPLFAELTEGVVPVALSTSVDMFHGTSTSVFKFLDPFYFLMNPRPEYRIEFLEKIPTEGDRIDVANRVQRELGKVLGFEQTTYTRKHKYLMLAGNEGVVETKPKTV